MKRFHKVMSAALAIACLQAATNIQASLLLNPNIFRDIRGANNVGIATGDILQFGADVAPGSAGFTISGIYMNSFGNRVTTFSQPCAPTSVNSRFCASGVGFNTARADGNWSVRIASANETLTAALPSSAIIPAAAVPFPSSVTITANGNTPTINWAYPAGYQPDALRISIYDKAVILANGTRDIVHTTVLSPNATEYTIPTTLSTRNGAHLITGRDYVFNFQMIDTRDNGVIQPATGNANLLSRSNSYFNFRVPEPGETKVIQLPVVSSDTGAYAFSVDHVGPDSVTYIDPAVAIGYDYVLGDGNPNFASVLFPDLQGDPYDLYYSTDGGMLHEMVTAGMQYFFPNGGVAGFRVSGIHPGLGLDPNNALAFVTGLTFASPGAFTGTMTPIVADVANVPEPGTLLLGAIGVIGLLGSRRRVGAVVQ